MAFDLLTLCPCEDWRLSAFVPEPVESQVLPGGFRYLEDDAAAGSHNFSCNIDELSPKCGGIALDGTHFRTDVLFEGFVEEESDKQRVTKGGVAGKPFEGKRFTAEFFEGPVDQFISPASVGSLDHGFCRETTCESRLRKLLIDRGAHPQVGVKDGLGPGKLKQKLTVCVHGATIDGLAKGVPAVSPAPKLEILPRPSPFDVSFSVPSLGLRRMYFDILVDSSRADGADSQLLKNLEHILVQRELEFSS